MELDYALSLVSRARLEADKVGAVMAFAVVDEGGHLIALTRMDGAQFVAARVAEGKAFTAAAFMVPSDEMAERLEERPQLGSAIARLTDGRFTPGMGGVPVIRNGRLSGAIGASGGTGEQDLAVAEAAVAGAESA